MKYNHLAVRAAAILTNSYVAGSVIGRDVGKDVQGSNQLVLQCALTKGSLDSAELKIEYSHDGSAWFQEATEGIDATTGTITVNPAERQFAASGNFAVSVPIKARLIRVSAKGTGTATGSSLSVNAVVGTV